MKDLKFNILLNDKYSVKMRSIASSSNKSFKSIQRDLQKTGKLGTNIESLNNKLDFLEKKRRISLDISDIKKVSAEMRQVKREIDLIERKGGIKTDRKSGLSSLAGKAGGLFAGLAIGAGAVQLGADIVQTTAKYEKFEAVLKNTYGSGLKAKQAMNDLQKFASDTPFQIDALTDSFIKLENSGFKPTMENMTNLGDLAASRGKSFDQLTEAILDAQTGEFERLKEFGIKGTKLKGGNYSFKFKGNSTEVGRSEEAVKAYILSLGKLKGVQGGMNAISKTTGGQLSNLADNWDQLKAVMGSANSGPVKDAISGFSSLISGAKDYLKVPLSQELGLEKAGINALVSSITDQNTSNDQRVQLLADLKAQYPDFIGDIDLETASNDKLLTKLHAVNASYEDRIRLQAASEVKDYNKTQLQDSKTEVKNANLQLDLIKQIKEGGINSESAMARFEENITLADRWDNLELIKLIPTPAMAAQLGDEYFNINLDEFEASYKNVILEGNKEIEKGKDKLNQSLLSEKRAEVEAVSNGLAGREFDKLTPANLKKFSLLTAQLSTNKSDLKNFGLQKGVKSGDKIVMQDNIKASDKTIAEINALFDPKKNKVNLTGGGAGGSKGGSGNKGGSKTERAIDSVAGDSRIAKNMTINIAEMMSGDVQIITETLKESSSEVKVTFLNMLLAAVNDVNGA